MMPGFGAVELRLYDLRLMRWLADFIYLIAGLVYLPVALYHALVVGKNRRGWGQRFGFGLRFEPGRRRIWMHAVSLGEINATPRLVEALRKRLPDVDIVFSTTTDTGFSRAVQLYGVDRVFRFPLDFSLVISRALRRVAPSLIVLVELEVWPNLMHLAAKRGIPVAVVNGRLTERSGRRLGCLGSIARSMFRRLAWVGAQDETIASRFHGLGVARERIEVTSSLKWDTAAVTDHVAGADALAHALGLDRTRSLWVCGSTGPGEEAMILEAYRRLLRPLPYGRGSDHQGDGPVARAVRDDKVNGGDAIRPDLAIIPRKPERFDEVARLIQREGFRCVRRSEHADGTLPAVEPEPGVVLGDTMGELRKFYSLADVVFVGRSLVPLGGSDPMEAAALGKPIIVGPHTRNFQLPVDALRADDAIRVVDSPAALADRIGAVLDDRASAKGMGGRAREVVLKNQGATGRTANRLAALLAPQRSGGMSALKADMFRHAQDLMIREAAIPPAER